MSAGIRPDVLRLFQRPESVAVWAGAPLEVIHDS
jgi:hypothetical protein